MKVLLTGAFPYTGEQIKQIKNLGCDVDFVQDERKALAMDCTAFNAVVCNALFMYNDIAAFKNLSYVQLTSAGLERAPLAYMEAHGIALRSARGVYSVPIAEWVVLKILEIYKASKTFYAQQNDRQWGKNRGLLELYGKTACIVGAGNIGLEVAGRLHAFGVTVTAVDAYKVESPHISRMYTVQELDQALAQSDITILTLPLTEQTRHMFDRERLLKMKDTGVLINVARGAVIKETDLVQVLLEGRFLGVALDVFETEPLSKDSPLWDMDRVLVTPHNCFVSDNTNERLFTLICKNLSQYING